MPTIGPSVHGGAQPWVASIVAALARTAVIAALCTAASHARAEAVLVLDGFDYANHTAARTAWPAVEGSPAVEMAESGPWGSERVMKLPCDFSVRPYRCAWDHTVSGDLSGYATFSLDVFVADSVPIGYFTLHFRSGGGWYGKNATIARPGWQTLHFDRIGFWSEGTPSGWNQIDGIRLSAWKEFATDTYLAARELRAVVPDLVIVRDTLSNDPGTVDRATTLLSDLLGSWGVHAAAVDGPFVELGGLTGAKMAILPYNETISTLQMTRIEDFVAAGGKLMVFYLLNDRLEDLLSLDLLAWTPGQFHSYTLADPAFLHLPPRVAQFSGNIMATAPRAQTSARVIGEWYDGAGRPTGKPAWVASANGLYMSHVLFDGDREAKRRMLLSLVGTYVPQVWELASAWAYGEIGRIAEYSDYDSAVADVRLRASGTPRAAQVDTELAAAGTARDLALTQRGSGNHADAVFTALDARDHLALAYALCQSPALPELRGAWEIQPTGPVPGDWSAGIAPLVTGGFGAIFPIMLTGGLAHYDSQYLPHSAEFTQWGDQIAACVAAAHARGIKVHVWKINYNLLGAPQSFIDAMRAAVRTQVSSTGAPIDWLCPSHPANLALERDTLLEIVSRYDVDGIHLDHIRYAGPDSCYCDGCRVRFQADTGSVVTQWPGGVLGGTPLRAVYLDWRREQVTKLVRAVYAGTKALKPSVVVSAAVWADYAWSRDGIGQDAAGWTDEGIVDAMCPMDYTQEHGVFRRRVAEQVADAAGRIPVWPGIGADSATSTIDRDGVIAQVLATREAGANGFVLFEYAQELIDATMPALASGTTIPQGAGPTPDGGAVSGIPLVLGKAASGQIDMSWGPACGSATDYGVYHGSLDALRAGTYDHGPVVCSTGGTTSARIDAAGDSAYFLVAGNDTSREGSYGRGTSGAPRPPANAPCLPEHVIVCP